MANQAQKRRLDANRRRLRIYLFAIAFANVWYVLLRFVVQGSSAFWFNYASLITSNAAYFIAYGILRNAAAPRYAPSGELSSAGADLSMGGFLEYVNDALILTLILQGLGAVTDWAWLLVLIVPGYGCYVAWTYYQQFQHTQQSWDDLGLRERESKVQQRRQQRSHR